MVKQIDWKTNSIGTSTTVIRKFGNWDIGFIKYRGNSQIFLMVRGQEYGEAPIIYPHNLQVAYDNPERIPVSVKRYLRENAGRIYELHKELNNSSLKAAGVPNYMSGYMN